MSDCTIVILTYKGKHHLEYLLPTVRTAIHSYSGNAVIDVLIVDNGCDIPTKEYANTNFPEFTYSFSPVNDYLFSLNSYVANISSEFVFIMNDDIKLDSQIFNRILPVINADESIFAVTCRFLDWETELSASAVRTATYHKGWFHHKYLDTNESEIKYTLYPSGGGAIFRTQMFNQLNGFDNLFYPGYSEDTDLGIRAWQNNWKVVYAPSAYVYHREGGTMKEYFINDKLDQMISRNHILWMIKNVRIPGFLFTFFLWLPYRIVYNYFKNRNLYKAILQAIPLMPKAIQKRYSWNARVKDRTWMAMLNTSPMIK